MKWTESAGAAITRRKLTVALAATWMAACQVESEPGLGGGGGEPEEGGGGGAACLDAPEPCGDHVECCEGSLCVMTGDEIACRPDCTEDAECETGCCAHLLGGGTACLAVDYCAVAP